MVIRARQLAGASIGFGAMTVWGALLGLLTTPFMIHRLGASSYGVFALITIAAAYLSNLEFGFGHATIRFLARARAENDPQAEEAVIGSSMAVFLPAAVAGGTIVLVGAPFIVRHFAHGPSSLHSTFVDAIRLGAAIVAISFITSFASSSLQALGRFQTVVSTRVVFSTLASLTAVTLAAAGGGLRGVLAAQVAVTSGLCIVLFRALARATDVPLKPRIHRSTFRAMAGFGIFILLSGLGTQIMIQAPPTVLAGYSTTAQVAAFAVPGLILQQLAGLVGATSLGFLPWVSAASVESDRSHVGAVYAANLRMTLLMIGPIAVYLAIFAHVLLATWIDPRFAAQAATPLRFLSVAVIVLAFSAPPADAARGFGRPALVTIYTALTSIATVSLAFAVVPHHGAAGAAFALTLGLAITTFPFAFLIASRLLRFSAQELLQSLTGPLLGLALIAAIFAAGAIISDGMVTAILAGAIGTSIYIAVALGLVLDAREREVFSGFASDISMASRRLYTHTLGRSRKPNRS